MTASKVSPSAVVQKRRLLGPGTHIEAGARLFADVRTGEGAHVASNAVLYGPLKIGDNSYIGPNCVVGFPSSAEMDKLKRSHESVGKRLTTIGDNCTVRSGTAIYSDVTIGDNVSFGHNALVREKVRIGRHTKVGTNSVVDGATTIGSHVSIQTGVYICTYSTIEDSVFLGPCCVLTNDKYISQKPFRLMGPTVRKGASVGANALLFPGIIVGEGAVIGSQAMVNVDVPPRTAYAGIPARKLRDLSNDWHSSLLKM